MQLKLTRLPFPDWRGIILVVVIKGNEDRRERGATTTDCEFGKREGETRPQTIVDPQEYRRHAFDGQSPRSFLPLLRSVVNLGACPRTQSRFLD